MLHFFGGLVFLIILAIFGLVDLTGNRDKDK